MVTVCAVCSHRARSAPVNGAAGAVNGGRGGTTRQPPVRAAVPNTRLSETRLMREPMLTVRNGVHDLTCRRAYRGATGARAARPHGAPLHRGFPEPAPRRAVADRSPPPPCAA